jgi:DNA repair protein RadA/Sms
MVEETAEEEKKRFSLSTSANPITLDEISEREIKRFKTGILEFDRVLGGGIVPGSFLLVGGEPGIGKSTLLLQIAQIFSQSFGPVLYISGEESLQQIKLRAERLKLSSKNLYLLVETNIKAIEKHIRALNPQLVVIDSIQTVFSPEIKAAAGSVVQIKETATCLMYLAKGLSIPIFIIGHVTKEGVIAGPRLVEHLVDTVLYFEGERYHTYRILRTVKNRFGSTNEIGVFRMESEGLREIPNPSAVFLNQPNISPGSVVVCTIEGTRPLLVELQALVSVTNFGIPRRTVLGVDYNRVCLLLAVLEKKLKYRFQNMDVYVNVAGGVKVVDPGIDLGIAIALISNFRNERVKEKVVLMGEVGLGGEIRNVSQIEKRIGEVEKLGFASCLVPIQDRKNKLISAKIKIKEVEDLTAAVEYLF